MDWMTPLSLRPPADLCDLCVKTRFLGELQIGWMLRMAQHDRIAEWTRTMHAPTGNPFRGNSRLFARMSDVAPLGTRAIKSAVPGSGLRIPMPKAEPPINPPRRNRRGCAAGLVPIRVHSWSKKSCPVFVSFVCFVGRKIRFWVPSLGFRVADSVGVSIRGYSRRFVVIPTSGTPALFRRQLSARNARGR